MERKNQIAKEEEINLFELVKVIWDKRGFVIKISTIFLALGAVIAFTSPKEYKTRTILIPELLGEQGKLGGSLGGLASLAGVDLGGFSATSQNINPALYQSVSRSTPFLLELMKQEYFFEDLDNIVSLENYFRFHLNTSLMNKLIALPFNLIKLVKKKDVLHELYENENNVNLVALSKEDLTVLENLSSRVFVEMDWELNIVTIEVEMQDPVVAAKMAEFTKNYITNYVTAYSISKSQKKLFSLENQYDERKEEFEKAQNKLAEYRDNNLYVNSARVKSEEERLQAEFNLAFNIYNQLAQQREAIKLQIEEETPVFTVLEPVVIPVKDSNPSKILIIFISTFFGSLIGLISILTRIFIIQSSHR